MHRSPANNDEWGKSGIVTHPDYGALATYIPADQIARIDIKRRAGKLLGSASD